MYFFQSFFAFLLFGFSYGSYVPGTPGICKITTFGNFACITYWIFLGINWSEEQAEIIKAKLEYLWVKKNSLDIVEGFDFNSTVHDPSNTDYLYDPEYKLSTVDCDWKEDLCETYWSGK